MQLRRGLWAAALTVALSVARTHGQTACNGSPELCSRPYSNVTQVGSHDSAFVGYLPQDNQYTSVTDQLNMGIRFLQAQTHNLNGQVELCHTYCWEEDAGALTSYLSTIKTWLAANPNEVLTLLLVNGDGLPVAQFGSAFEAAGLNTYALAPSGTIGINSWSTLGELISAGTRLVVFMDTGANTASVPYILDEFTYFFETPYDTTDPSFPECTLDRPAGGSPTGRMYIVNHFLDVDIFSIDIPDQLAASNTNSVSSILAQSKICYQDYGRVPNFILLDYVSEGNPIGAQNSLNNLS